MAITLGGITLPADLEWSDQHQWSPIERAAIQYGLTGAPVFNVAVKLAGRPITLSCGADRWVDTATLAALQALNAQPTWKGPLVLADGRTLQVRFREAGIKADPVAFAAPNDAMDGWWTVEILLWTA